MPFIIDVNVPSVANDDREINGTEKDFNVGAVDSESPINADSTYLRVKSRQHPRTRPDDSDTQILLRVGSAANSHPHRSQDDAKS